MYASHLSIGRVVHIHELVNSPVEPSHEEDSEGQAMCEQHEGSVVPEAAGVDVPDHVILKNSHPVVHVSPAHMGRGCVSNLVLLEPQMLFISNNIFSPMQPKCINLIGLVKEKTYTGLTYNQEHPCIHQPNA